MRCADDFVARLHFQRARDSVSVLLAPHTQCLISAASANSHSNASTSGPGINALLRMTTDIIVSTSLLMV